METRSRLCRLSGLAPSYVGRCLRQLADAGCLSTGRDATRWRVGRRLTGEVRCVVVLHEIRAGCSQVPARLSRPWSYLRQGLRRVRVELLTDLRGWRSLPVVPPDRRSGDSARAQDRLFSPPGGAPPDPIALERWAARLWAAGQRQASRAADRGRAARRALEHPLLPGRPWARLRAARHRVAQGRLRRAERWLARGLALTEAVGLWWRRLAQGLLDNPAAALAAVASGAQRQRMGGPR